MRISNDLDDAQRRSSPGQINLKFVAHPDAQEFATKGGRRRKNAHFGSQEDNGLAPACGQEKIRHRPAGSLGLFFCLLLWLRLLLLHPDKRSQPGGGIGAEVQKIQRPESIELASKLLHALRESASEIRCFGRTGVLGVLGPGLLVGRARLAASLGLHKDVQLPGDSRKNRIQ